MPLLPYEGSVPEVADDAWVAPGAVLVGRVRLGSRSSVWYGAVLRGDEGRIVIGRGSKVQDNAVIHTTSSQSANQWPNARHRPPPQAII